MAHPKYLDRALTKKERSKIYWNNLSSRPWVKTYRSIKLRTDQVSTQAYKYYGGKGIKCLITSEEIKELWFRDKAYLLKKPSINRKNSKGHYTKKNCEFIELSENSKKPLKTHCPKGHLYCDKNSRRYKNKNGYLVWVCRICAMDKYYLKMKILKDEK